jgi:triacylglycerol lipase
MSKKNECVILLHGLGRTKYSLAKLESELLQDYGVVNISYPSRKHTIEELAKIAVGGSLVKCLDNYSKVHFVTHSLGGILVRQYLSEHHVHKLGNVVMLGPPNKGSELVDFFRKSPFLERLFANVNGPAGRQLSTAADSIPNLLGEVDFPLGVIAGTRNFNFVYWNIMPKKSDGKVSVSSSKVHGMTDHLVLPVDHTFMMRDRTVIRQVKAFIKDGKFERDLKTQ